MSLSGSEKRELRAKANRLEAKVFLGGKGLTDAFINELNFALKEQKLVKVKLSKGCENRKETAKKLAEVSKSELIQINGFNALLYKK